MQNSWKPCICTVSNNAMNKRKKRKKLTDIEHFVKIWKKTTENQAPSEFRQGVQQEIDKIKTIQDKYYEDFMTKGISAVPEKDEELEGNIPGVPGKVREYVFLKREQQDKLRKLNTKEMRKKALMEDPDMTFFDEGPISIAWRPDDAEAKSIPEKDLQKWMEEAGEKPEIVKMPIQAGRPGGFINIFRMERELRKELRKDYPNIIEIFNNAIDKLWGEEKGGDLIVFFKQHWKLFYGIVKEDNIENNIENNIEKIRFFLAHFKEKLRKKLESATKFRIIYQVPLIHSLFKLIENSENNDKLKEYIKSRKLYEAQQFYDRNERFSQNIPEKCSFLCFFSFLKPILDRPAESRQDTYYGHEPVFEAGKFGGKKTKKRIKINPKMRGVFTRKAKRNKMSVQKYATYIIKKYKGKTRNKRQLKLLRQAVFAKTAKKWKKRKKRTKRRRKFRK